jgi:hypothetical protein
VAVYTPFAAGQVLTADQLNTLIVAETMEWTSLASLGAYASGFSAGNPAPRMRKIMMAGTEMWQYEGKINASGLAPATLTTAFTFNAGFRPGSERGFMTYATSAGFYAMFLAIQPTGLLRVGVPTASGGAASASLDGVWITNPSL